MSATRLGVFTALVGAALMAFVGGDREWVAGLLLVVLGAVLVVVDQVMRW